MSDTVETTIASVRAKRRAVVSGMSVSLDGHNFDLGALPTASLEYCGMQGFKSYLLAAEDPTNAYAKLMSGDLPTSRSPATPKMSKRRVALAHALAHESAKSVAAPGTKKAAIEADAQSRVGSMMEYVSALPRASVDAHASRPDVKAHYDRLYGAKPEENAPSLLDAVGLGVPAAA